MQWCCYHNCDRKRFARYQRRCGSGYMRRIVVFVNSDRRDYLFVVPINGAIGKYRGNCYSKPNCYYYLYSNRHDGRV